MGIQLYFKIPIGLYLVMLNNFGDRAFSVAAPRAWNRLPTDLKLLRSTASFKSKLKSFMFHAAYTENTM